MTPMRIYFRKLSDDRYALRVVRPDGAAEEAICETRSTLVHDFLHFAVEKAANLSDGFWGNLARGKTLAAMNDRTGASLGAEGTALADVERIVGAFSGAAKGLAAADVVDGIRRYHAAMDRPPPAWLTEPFVRDVQERLRRIRGAWNATPHQGSMELEW
jgi:hypothetical protein